MLTGWPPFYNKDRKKLFDSIMYEDPPPHRAISPVASDLINKLLTKDANLRLGAGPEDANEVKEHPWFSEIGFESLY
jgi:serine/threonine protein kinase